MSRDGVAYDLLSSASGTGTDVSASASTSIKNLPRGDAHDQLPRRDCMASLCRGTKKDGQRCTFNTRHAWELCRLHADQERDLCRAQFSSQRNMYCTRLAHAGMQYCLQHRDAQVAAYIEPSPLAPSLHAVAAIAASGPCADDERRRNSGAAHSTAQLLAACEALDFDLDHVDTDDRRELLDLLAAEASSTKRLDRNRLAQLRSACEALELPASGVKSDLCQRLHEHLVPARAPSRIGVSEISNARDVRELESILDHVIREANLTQKGFGKLLEAKGRNGFTMLLRSDASRLAEIDAQRHVDGFQIDHILECQIVGHAILQSPQWTPLLADSAVNLLNAKKLDDVQGALRAELVKVYRVQNCLRESVVGAASTAATAGAATVATGATTGDASSRSPRRCADVPLDDPFNFSLLHQSLNCTKGHAYSAFVDSRWNNTHFEGLRWWFRKSTAVEHGVLEADEADALSKKIHADLQNTVRDRYLGALEALSQVGPGSGDALSRQRFSGLHNTVETLFDEFESMSVRHD